MEHEQVEESTCIFSGNNAQDNLKEGGCLSNEKSGDHYSNEKLHTREALCAYNRGNISQKEVLYACNRGSLPLSCKGQAFVAYIKQLVP